MLWMMWMVSQKEPSIFFLHQLSCGICGYCGRCGWCLRIYRPKMVLNLIRVCGCSGGCEWSVGENPQFFFFITPAVKSVDTVDTVNDVWEHICLKCFWISLHSLWMLWKVWMVSQKEPPIFFLHQPSCEICGYCGRCGWCLRTHMPKTILNI